MKKNLSYILIGVIIAAVVVLFLKGQKTRHEFDERVTFQKRDKIPYGTYVAYQGLKQMFPHASIYTNKKEPGFWDSLSEAHTDQAIFIICPELNADKYEMKNLISFVENGNDVFISTMELSYEVTELLNCSINSTSHLVAYYLPDGGMDTLTISLARPPFPEQDNFIYPGKQYDGYFSKLDTVTTSVLGYDQNGRPDFVQLRAGKGNLYIHLAPMAFTNYFLLHKNNFAFYEKTLSVISPDTKKVLWDEYYLYKKNTKTNRDEKNKNWLSLLLNTKNAAGQKPFAAAFWVLILLLVVYVLIEMRRKQRFIPIVKKPQNDSLEFVKTIGRLYHDKADHINLTRKMGAYFLEHVRNRYKLVTSQLNEEFVLNLHHKTGIDKTEIAEIVNSIRFLDTAVSSTPGQLIQFHKQLESFYKKE